MENCIVQISFEIKDNKIKGFVYSPSDISEEQMLMILESLCKGIDEKRATRFLLNEAQAILDDEN